MQLTVPMWHHYDIGAKFGPDATKNGNLNGLHHGLSPVWSWHQWSYLAWDRTLTIEWELK